MQIWRPRSLAPGGTTQEYLGRLQRQTQANGTEIADQTLLPILSEDSCVQTPPAPGGFMTKGGEVAPSAKLVTDRSDATALISRALSGGTSIPPPNVSHPAHANLQREDPALPAARFAMDKVIVPSARLPWLYLRRPLRPASPVISGKLPSGRHRTGAK